ncbi:hypothetical protein PROFUN_06995 [Planoprotostelium fungivorum]|uniref:Aminoglycoside phosphotransferase domain-containing protein n=1 Tax=Planoprotostelium fungivorum TaxID=1890364 RepID=A0A2P6NMN7_9EUKA|nr:hypothetical protein PROFUN_06995 [Planoprotostelium fungivorum]
MVASSKLPLLLLLAVGVTGKTGKLGPKQSATNYGTNIMVNAGDIRQSIDVEKLTTYLVQHIPHLKAPLTVKQFKFGQSNPTYFLEDANQLKLVMRKKPPGELLSKTAHAVEREYKILKALQDTPVPTPKVYCLCEDRSVLGTPFYVMEFLKGRIFEDASMPQLPPQERRACWLAAVDALTKLHSIDPKSVGLSDYGRPTDFYPRQLRTLSTISQTQSKVTDGATGNSVGDIPHIKDILDFFNRNLPKDRTTIVHGDYKIDNMVFHPTEARVIGILDWELSTIGHPLSDVANLCHPYSLPYFKGAANSGFVGHEVEGIPKLEEVISAYKKGSGVDATPDWTFVSAFAHFRLAVIAQGIASRVYRKQASSESAHRTAALFPVMGELCWSTIESAVPSSKL